MYMNCAVVNVVPKGSHEEAKRSELSVGIEKKDVQRANAAAQAALSSYPELFVANLKSVNDCVTKESQDVIFDTPGKNVQFADGQSSSGKPSFGTKKCTGKGSKNAGSSSPPSSPGQWTPSPPSNPGGDTTNCNDGQYHPACYGGPASQKPLSGSVASAPAQAKAQVKAAPQAQGKQQVQDVKTGGKPPPQVEKELDTYLKSLYGNSRLSKRATCDNTNPPTGGCSSPGRWVRKGECTWACERQGTTTMKTSTSTKKTTPTPTSAKEVEQNLKSLGTNISKMVQLVIAKQSAQRASTKDFDSSLSQLNTDITKLVQASVKGTTSKQTEANLNSFQGSLKKVIQGITPQKAAKLRRQDLIPEPVSTLTPTPSTFDLFLAYLSRLQTTVIDCIRNIAASTPPTPISAVSIPAVPIAAAPANIVQGLVIPQLMPVTKRQLVAPSLSTSDWFNGVNLPSDVETDPVFAGLRDLGLDWERLYDSLRPEGEGTQDDRMETVTLPVIMKAPELEAVGPPKRNFTSKTFFANSSSEEPGVNALQQAADEAEFQAAVAADEAQNSPPVSNSTATNSTASKKESDAAALLPYFLGPGPVIPPGVIVDWPGPKDQDIQSEEQVVSNLEDFPMVVDDLGPESEDQVRKFFADLAKEASEGSGKDGSVV
jgi:hypothetical protein